MRHGVLEGEGVGDPVEAEGEMAEAKQPAAREGGAAVGGGFDEPEE